VHPPGHVGAVPQVCATDVRRPRRDVQGTHNLLAAARAAGAPHLVYVSIVGVDRVPVPYYRIKLEVEQLVEASCLPWTVLRATQFHDLVASALRVLTRPPVVLLPAGTAFQPVDVRDVAPRLVELALAPATGRGADLGGPQVRAVTDLSRAYLDAVGRRGPARLLGEQMNDRDHGRWRRRRAPCAAGRLPTWASWPWQDLAGRRSARAAGRSRHVVLACVRACPPAARAGSPAGCEFRRDPTAPSTRCWPGCGLLVLDELHAHDPGDAMLLSRPVRGGVGRRAG
jgi:hypothetical protein